MHKIAKRSADTGLKLVKFHVVLHAFDAILKFGVPQEFGASTKEGHHRVGSG